MPTKRIFLDVETTGLWETKHAIHQFAGIIEVDGKVVDTFDLRMRPWPGAVIDTDKKTGLSIPMMVSGKSDAEINAYPDPAVQVMKFLSICEKHIDFNDKNDRFFLIAYNAEFDTKFVRMMMMKFGQGNPFQRFGKVFRTSSICARTTAMVALEERITELKDHKLGSVAEAFGLKPEGELHDAMTDIKLTRDVFYACFR